MKKPKRHYKVLSYWDKVARAGTISTSITELCGRIFWSRTTLYKALKDRGYYDDLKCTVFWLDKSEVLKGGVRNKKIPKRRENSERYSIYNDLKYGENTFSEPIPVKIEEKHDIEPILFNKEVGGVKGDQGGVQGSTHEKVSTPPSPPVEILFDPIVPAITPDEPIDLSSDDVTHRDVGKKIKPKREVNPMAKLPGESHTEWAKRISGDPNIKTGINY